MTRNKCYNMTDYDHSISIQNFVKRPQSSVSKTGVFNIHKRHDKLSQSMQKGNFFGGNKSFKSGLSEALHKLEATKERSRLNKTQVTVIIDPVTKQPKPPAAAEEELEFTVSNLVQFIPEYEEHTILDLKEYDPKAFKLFKHECE